MPRSSLARAFTISELVTVCFAVSSAVPVRAASQQAATVNSANAAADIPKPKDSPANDYVIGPDDLLSVVFWRDQQLSGDVLVRPDGKISLPLIDDVPA